MSEFLSANLSANLSATHERRSNFVSAELSAAHVLKMSAELSGAHILTMSAELSAAHFLVSALMLCKKVTSKTLNTVEPRYKNIFRHP